MLYYVLPSPKPVSPHVAIVTPDLPTDDSTFADARTMKDSGGMTTAAPSGGGGGALVDATHDSNIGRLMRGDNAAAAPGAAAARLGLDPDGRQAGAAVRHGKHAGSGVGQLAGHRLLRFQSDPLRAAHTGRRIG